MKPARALVVFSALALMAGWMVARPPVAAAARTMALPSEIPQLISSHAAHADGLVARSSTLDLAVTLPLRHQALLNRTLAAISTPGSPQYGHYLTQAQANRLFAPTPASVASVVSWLRSGGLAVKSVSANRLAINVQGSESAIGRLFSTRLGWYRSPHTGRFYAARTTPSIPTRLSRTVLGVVGLDSIPAHTADAPPTNGERAGFPPFFPQDLADVYDISPLWAAGYNGAGEHIGITLWIPPPTDGNLQRFAAYTGANVVTRAAGTLVVHPVGGVNKNHDVEEAGMDVEYSSGMAPGATVDFWLMKHGSGPYLYNALNRAGLTSGSTMDHVISSSWGSCEGSTASQKSMEQMFALNSVTGHDYLFSSGDTGSFCATGHQKTDGVRPDFPASSPYVTAVGGTSFDGLTNGIGSTPGTWPGETAWKYNKRGNYGPWCDTRTCPEGSGGGFSKDYARPAWQPSDGTHTTRGYPDVAALADPEWGVYACEDADCPSPLYSYLWGGTSLSSPVWAGITADIDQMLQTETASQTTPATTGFIDPSLYGLGGASQEFAPFHDITVGQNGGYKTATGWDAVTGLGTPDAYNLARDWLGLNQPSWHLTSSFDAGSGVTTLSWETLRPETGYNVFDGATQVNPVGQLVTSGTADYTYQTDHVFANPPTVVPAQ